jgi:outer membrane protein assembly factor BamB
VVAADTGRLVWKHHLGGAEFREPSQTSDFPCPPNIGRQRPALIDLNRDGFLDIVVLAEEFSAGSRRGQDELRALDGKDGKLLWKVPLPARRGGDVAIGTGPDGPIVLLASFPHDGRQQPVVTALDGKDGRELWQFPAPASALFCFDLEGKGLSAVGAIGEGAGANLGFQVLGGHGKALKRMEIRFPRGIGVSTNQWAASFRAGHADLKGDGKEAVVFVNGGIVQAWGGSLDQPLWEWKLPDGKGDILYVQPARKDKLGYVAVRRGGSVFGLDDTGQLRWRCDGPGQAAAFVEAGSTDALPTILFHMRQPETTVCRQALPVNANGQYRFSLPPPVVLDPPPDLWGVVSLPWEYQGQHFAGKAVLPALLCLALLGFFGRRRRWITLAGLLLLLVAVPTAVAFIQWNEGVKHLAPEQHYSWSGWYWIVPYTQGATFSSIQHVWGPEWNPLRSPFWWMVGWLVLVAGRNWLKRGRPGAC